MTPGQNRPLKISCTSVVKKAGPTATVKKKAAPNHTAALSTPINLSTCMTRRTLRKSPPGAKRERSGVFRIPYSVFRGECSASSVSVQVVYAIQNTGYGIRNTEYARRPASDQFRRPPRLVRRRTGPEQFLALAEHLPGRRVVRR